MHCFRQHPTGSLCQRHGFALARCGEGKNAIKGFGNGKHQSASNRPDFPPSFSTSRMSEITMPLSTALTMS